MRCVPSQYGKVDSQCLSWYGEKNSMWTKWICSTSPSSLTMVPTKWIQAIGSTYNVVTSLKMNKVKLESYICVLRFWSPKMGFNCFLSQCLKFGGVWRENVEECLRHSKFILETYLWPLVCHWMFYVFFFVEIDVVGS